MIKDFSMKHFTALTTMFILLFSSSCSNQKKISSKDTSNSRPNILFIIADDLGSDAFPPYRIGKEQPKMQNIEKLVQNGIRFNNFWAYPTCTPTRASIITGKHAFRSGVKRVGDKLSTKETILQKFIEDKTDNHYSSAVIGKWHLSDDTNHPNKMGLKYFSGILSGGVRDYYSWRHIENGNTERSKEYITSKFTDLAIDWRKKQTKPWFLWLAYTAPHTPFHLPPEKLHSYKNLSGNDDDVENNPQPYFFSMIEALDTEIGRLMESIPQEELDNTVIIFMGDNGSPNKVVQTYGRRKAKGSIYQGGINVPLVISGANVNRINQVEDALINSTDLFATIAEIAGTGINEIYDSKSIVPIFSQKNKTHKGFLYSEVSKKRKTGFTIRNKQYKYIKYENGQEELFDLIEDPYESNNLIDNTSLKKVKQELTTEVNKLRNS